MGGEELSCLFWFGMASKVRQSVAHLTSSKVFAIRRKSVWIVAAVVSHGELVSRAEFELNKGGASLNAWCGSGFQLW